MAAPQPYATSNKILKRENGILEVQLTQGKIMVCDDSQAAWELLRDYRYYAKLNRGNFYAATNLPRCEIAQGKTQTAYFHAQIHPSTLGLLTDHRNTNSLDNRAANLRSVSANVNKANQVHRYRNNTTGATGISELKNDKKGRKAFIVRWLKDGDKRESHKYFSHALCGGRDKAFELAKAFRHEMCMQQKTYREAFDRSEAPASAPAAASSFTPAVSAPLDFTI